MTRLSVNINKLATLRNARGGNNPDLLDFAARIQEYGAEGITVHPRPDERHIRYADARALKEVVHTEYNIEGNPNERFMALVKEVRPDQVTLVPDAPDVLTSNAGWKATETHEELRRIVSELKDCGMRVSLFMDPDTEQIEALESIRPDRIELYTETYASAYAHDPVTAVAPFVTAAELAVDMGLGINAGHDLDMDNLTFFVKKVPSVLEVSIGHALVCDALDLGMENVVQMYKRRLR